MFHNCPIPNCPNTVTMEKLMCNWHWRFVPRALQREVYAAYNHGECRPEHAARCADATAVVASKMAALRN